MEARLVGERENFEAVEKGVHPEFVMDVGRLPSGGDVKAPAEGSGPTFMTTISRCAPEKGAPAAVAAGALGGGETV
jgi:hypothetical protein